MGGTAEMAYQSKALSALGYANGFTLWHYRTQDSEVDVEAIGYLNPASRMVRVGDFIMLNANIRTSARHAILVVAENADGLVKTITMGRA